MASSLHCFGTGDGMANGEAGHSAYSYQLGGTGLLVDCGEPLSRAYKASGRSYEAFDGILLSHTHFDHVGGLFMFLQGVWLEKRSKELPIWLPVDAIEPVRQMLRAGYLYDELLPFNLKWQPLHAGRAFEVGDARVTPFATTHLKGYRERFGEKYPRPYDAFSFLLETKGLRVAHSADIGSVGDLEPLLSQPLDLLCCELAHIEPEELIRCLSGRAVRKLLLTHVGRKHRPNVDEIITRAMERLDLPVIAAHDGLNIPLTAEL